mgnify:FL=1
MNPEDFENINTTHTIWTLIDSNGNSVTFKVPSSGNRVTITDNSCGKYQCHRETARDKWNDYMKKGYHISNKCVDYDMDEFYNGKRNEERNEKVMKSISASMEEYVKKIHDNDLQEMRINPKKFYTEFYKDKWDNYALEA